MSRLICCAVSLQFFVLMASNAVGQQWTKLGAPGSGGVYSLANEGDTIYAGTQSWLIRSTNLGETWASADTGLPFGFLPISITAGGSSLFVAVVGASGGTIYRSTNHGTTWVRSDTSLPLGAYARTVKYHQGRVYAGIIGTPGSTVGGLYVSTNSGSSWNQIPGGPDTNVTSIAAAGDSLFVGTTISSVHISTNLGQTWWDTTVTTFPGVEIREILPAGPFLYAATGGYGVHRSSDNGRTWVVKNDSIDYPFHWSRPLARIGETLFVGYDNNGALPCGGIWKSTNNGDLWLPTSGRRMTQVLGTCNIDTAYYLGYALLARHQTLFAGTFGFGVFRSTDLGVTWAQVASPIQTRTMTVLGRSGDTLYTGGENGGHFWISTDNGNHWDQYTYELSGSVTSIVKMQQLLFAGQGFGSGVARSSDGGQTWTRSTAGPTNSVNCMATDNGTLFAGTDGGLYKSTNSGDQWALTAYTVPAHNLLVKGDVILVNRTEFGTQRTFRSTNAGASFDTVAGGLPTNFIAHEYISMGPRIIALGVAIGNGAVYSSTDDGFSWTNISGPLTFARCSAVSGDTLYVRASIGATTVLRRTTDFGQTWTNVPTSGLPNAIFEDLIIHNGYLFGVGNQTSVWRMSLGGPVDVEDGDSLPASLRLEHNYPNPFNPSTIIGFQLTRYGHVRLGIYDLLGREIAVLIDGQKGPGDHAATWDASGKPSGVYFYRLTAGGYSLTRKMLLIR